MYIEYLSYTEEDESSTEEVFCPQCRSKNLFLHETEGEKVDLYDGIDYPCECMDCGHLFYLYEDLYTKIH